MSKLEKKRIDDDIKARFPNESWARKKKPNKRKSSVKRRESTKLTEVSIVAEQ